jgi:hypothetical protein
MMLCIMLVSTIVLIVVRLFSIQWLVQGLSMLAVSFSEQAYASNDSLRFLRFLPPVSLIVLSVIGWIVAPCLSVRIPGQQNVSLPVTGLSLRDLYCFAFVFLGLYFSLGSVADVLNWLHYSMLASLGHDFDPARKISLYALSRPLITFLAGLICIFSGRGWASKLSDHEAKAE